MALRALTAGFVCGVAFCLQACATTASDTVVPNPLMQRAVSDVAAPKEEWQMELGQMGKDPKAASAAPATNVRAAVASDGKLQQTP